MYATAFSNENIFERINKNSSVEQQKFRAEKNLAVIDKIHKLIGDDIPWASEDDMIRELADMRRQKLRS